MKVIDLLNKIANGEEVPKKIKYLTSIYTLRNNNNYYVENSDSSYSSGLYYQMIGGSRLNDKVEIIEEDKKIEKLIIGKDDVAWCEGNMKTDEEMVDIVLEIKDKINEIIEVLNEEK